MHDEMLLMPSKATEILHGKLIISKATQDPSLSILVIWVKNVVVAKMCIIVAHFQI